MLGCLDPGHHVLEFGSTIIKAGTRVSPRTMVPSVRYLATEIRFLVRNDAKMFPLVLRCFPNVETLSITSGKTDQSVGKLNLKFWHKSGTIECIQSSIKLLVCSVISEGVEVSSPSSIFSLSAHWCWRR